MRDVFFKFTHAIQHVVKSEREYPNVERAYVYKSNGYWVVTDDASKPQFVPPPPPKRVATEHTYVVTVVHVDGEEPDWPDWIQDPDERSTFGCYC